ncbi:MAG: Calx-beta domain-containing protein [Actinomycetota bacterium]
MTVSRDAAVNPSDIHVSTIDESAKAPADYTKLDEQVELTSETSKTLSITIVNDTAAEGAETFRVHLSDPGGCAVNPNYQVAPDARVTIQASDQVAPTAQPPEATQPASPTLPTAAARPSPTAPPSPTATIDVTSTPSATFVPLAQAEDEDGGGFPVAGVIGIVLGALAIAAVGGLLWYRRRTA